MQLGESLEHLGQEHRVEQQAVEGGDGQVSFVGHDRGVRPTYRLPQGPEVLEHQEGTPRARIRNCERFLGLLEAPLQHRHSAAEGVEPAVRRTAPLDGDVGQERLDHPLAALAPAGVEEEVRDLQIRHAERAQPRQEGIAERGIHRLDGPRRVPSDLHLHPRALHESRRGGAGRRFARESIGPVQVGLRLVQATARHVHVGEPELQRSGVREVEPRHVREQGVRPRVVVLRRRHPRGLRQGERVLRIAPHHALRDVVGLVVTAEGVDHAGQVDAAVQADGIGLVAPTQQGLGTGEVAKIAVENAQVVEGAHVHGVEGEQVFVRMDRLAQIARGALVIGRHREVALTLAQAVAVSIGRGERFDPGAAIPADVVDQRGAIAIRHRERAVEGDGFVQEAQAARGVTRLAEDPHGLRVPGQSLARGRRHLCEGHGSWQIREGRADPVVELLGQRLDRVDQPGGVPRRGERGVEDPAVLGGDDPCREHEPRADRPDPSVDHRRDAGAERHFPGGVTRQRRQGAAAHAREDAGDLRRIDEGRVQASLEVDAQGFGDHTRDERVAGVVAEVRQHDATPGRQRGTPVSRGRGELASDQAYGDERHQGGHEQPAATQANPRE